MSSVLEALKRMEEEEKGENIASLVWNESPGKVEFRRFLSFVAVFAAGVGVAVAGFYLAHRPVMPVVPAAEAPKEASKEVPVYRVVLLSAPSAVKPAGTKALEKPAPPVAAAPPALKRPVTEKAIRAESPAGKGADLPVDSETNTSGDVESKATEVLPSVKEGQQILEDTHHLPVADAAKYQLQGVRWSETPSRRIAVINGQILREGAMVDGAKVLTITAEGVILHVEGSRRFLAFSGR